MVALVRSYLMQFCGKTRIHEMGVISINVATVLCVEMEADLFIL